VLSRELVILSERSLRCDGFIATDLCRCALVGKVHGSFAAPRMTRAEALWANQMSERALTELLRGKGAHADPVACVEDISAEVAARALDRFPHSIGQIIFHLNYWLSYDLRRIRGEKPAYPEHAAESWPTAPTPADAAEWDRLRRDFGWLLAEYGKLAESSAADLAREIEPAHEGQKKISSTLGAVLWQAVAHNSYHVGQIAMIRRMLGAWPPKAGGDSW